MTTVPGQVGESRDTIRQWLLDLPVRENNCSAVTENGQSGHRDNLTMAEFGAKYAKEKKNLLPLRRLQRYLTLRCTTGLLPPPMAR